MSLFNSARHLLPKSPLWRWTPGNWLALIFEIVGECLDDVRTYYDRLWLDAFPSTSRELNAWDAVQGVRYANMTEAERRERFAGWLTAQGGQSPRYIQDVLQASGFPVYVHDWWSDNVPTVRDPHILIGATLGAGDPEMEAGEPLAEAGQFEGDTGYILVNKLYIAGPNYTCLAGEEHMEAGEELAAAGEYDGIEFLRVGYQVPDDPATWPYFMYVGGETFGDVVVLPESRREEFEDLLLRICPEHLWLGLFIQYSEGYVVDNDGFYVVDNDGNRIIVEAF